MRSFPGRLRNPGALSLFHCCPYFYLRAKFTPSHGLPPRFHQLRDGPAVRSEPVFMVMQQAHGLFQELVYRAVGSSLHILKDEALQFGW